MAEPVPDLPPDPPGERHAEEPPAAASGAGAGQSGLIVGRPEVIQAWRDLLLGLAQADAGSRQLVLVDRDFADFPLDEPAVLQALTEWLRRPGRSLCLLGVDFETTARKHPRFARWRRDWLHRIACRVPQELPVRHWPCLMVSDHRVIERLDDGAWRARLHTEAEREAPRIEALTQQSEAGWPQNVLGL